jgi:hypothetical protein
LHTSEVNGICTYSYNISGTTYGPFTETNNQCNGSLFTSNVNGINHTTVKVNGVVVYQD